MIRCSWEGGGGSHLGLFWAMNPCWAVPGLGIGSRGCFGLVGSGTVCGGLCGPNCHCSFFWGELLLPRK